MNDKVQWEEGAMPDFAHEWTACRASCPAYELLRKEERKEAAKENLCVQEFH